FVPRCDPTEKNIPKEGCPVIDLVFEATVKVLSLVARLCRPIGRTRFATGAVSAGARVVERDTVREILGEGRAGVGGIDEGAGREVLTGPDGRRRLSSEGRRPHEVAVLARDRLGAADLDGEGGG